MADSGTPPMSQNLDSPGSGWFAALLLLLVAGSTYLNVPLMSGSRVLVPSLATVTLAPLLFLVVRNSVTTADVVFLLKMAFVLLLSIALSPGYVYLQEKFFAMAQLMLALGVAVLMVRLMRQLRLETLERVLQVMWLLIIVGSILEIVEVTKAISDTFRAWACQDLSGFYDADMRDFNLVGWSRPKLFSEEPSHVTKFFIVTINAWLAVRVTGTKALVAGGATAIMVVIMGSPMLLVSAAMTLSILVWNQQVRVGTRVATVAGVLLIGAAVGVFFAEDTFSNVATRITTIDDSEVESTQELGGDERRVVLPWATLADIWMHWPVFGVGIGGKEVVAVFRNMPDASPTFLIGNNAFASIGIFLGIVGGFLFAVLGLRQASQTGVHRLGLFAVLVFLFSQLIAGIDTCRYWGFIALLWGAVAVADCSAQVGGDTEDLAANNDSNKSEVPDLSATAK
jgi:hypothetical protein